MKLIELISILRNIEATNDVIEKTLPGVEIDFVVVYMKDSINIESPIILKNYNETDGKIELSVDGMTYLSLFSLSMLQEIITDLIEQNGSDEQIGEYIIQYRINDA